MLTQQLCDSWDAEQTGGGDLATAYPEVACLKTCGKAGSKNGHFKVVLLEEHIVPFPTPDGMSALQSHVQV